MSSSSATLERPDTRAPVAPNPSQSQKSQSDQTPKAPKNRRSRVIIFAALGLAILAWGGHFIWHAYHYETTDDAFVAGHIHRISAQISGIVKEVRVEDNQVVSAGEPLVLIDPAEYQIDVDQARAAVSAAQAQEAQARAAVEQAEAGYTTAEARRDQAVSQVEQLRAQRDLARLTLTRTEQLFNNNAGAATQADLDNARSGLAAAEAATSAAEANVAAAKAGVTAAAATRDAARAQASAAQAAIATAQAAQRDAELKLSYTTITAPVAGRIGNKAVESGNRIQAGQTLFALASPEMWVIANFKETQLAHMRPGQPVEITVDALPGEKLAGHIESLSPASGAQFALLPPDNATGNFNKVVQRVPVKIVFEPEALRRVGDRLRLGLSVVPEVRIR